MAVHVQTRYTLEEYFELEYNSATRHEYINGKIVPMAYSAKPHGKIISNLHGTLYPLLRNSDLEFYMGDRMLYVPDCNKIYYPDMVIIPQNVEIYNYKGKMIADLHPIVLVEVLSDSTEDNDRQSKWNCYRKIDSLQQYVLISQKIKEVEIYNRQPEPNNWQYSVYETADSIMEIATCKIQLKDIYHKVVLPEPQAYSDEISEIS